MKKIIYTFLIVMLTQTIFAHGGEKDDKDKKTENLITFNENEEIVTTEIIVSDWEFTSTMISLEPDKKNRLIFTIESGHHGIRIPGFGLETGNMEPGEFVIWDISEYPEGEYSYYCNTPCGRGHSNMSGKINIRKI